MRKCDVATRLSGRSHHPDQQSSGSRRRRHLLLKKRLQLERHNGTKGLEAFLNAGWAIM